MDVRSFVYYAWDSQDVVVGVKEFQVAKALLEGRQNLLSQEVPSQWGPVHLFDLCLTFGHVDTALAMAESGVQGCRLAAYHLKRNWSEPIDYDGDVSDGIFYWAACKSCYYKWETCQKCCFGFPTEQGVWMNDWDVKPEEAANAAWSTVEQPLVSATLEVLRSGASLPFDVSEEAMAHLLDIAILTGNKEAAKCCADLTKQRPLRRWSFWSFVWEDSSFRLHIDSACLLAALSAGAELQDLTDGGLSLREAVVLSSAEWDDFAELLPPKSPWVMEGKDLAGNYFIEIDADTHMGILSKEKLQKALAAKIPLCNFQMRAFLANGHADFSLLDMAILTGQFDSAVLCATMGVNLSQDGCRSLQQNPAAAAAAQKFLSLSWKSAISLKGVVVYQVMKKFSRGRPFQAKLVNQMIAFSIDVPEIVKKLNLWEEANAYLSDGWMIEQSFDGLTEAADAFAPAEKAPPSTAAASTLQPKETSATTPETVDEKATDDLMMAMRESRDEVPPLNIDGVQLFRLTMFPNASHVLGLLFDANGPLQALHQRVGQTGCRFSAGDVNKFWWILYILNEWSCCNIDWYKINL